MARRIGPPVNATVRASGAFSRNVTVRSSLTSGEIRLAPYGFRPWVFLCGFQSRLTCACWADAATEPAMIASTTKSVVFMEGYYPLLGRAVLGHRFLFIANIANSATIANIDKTSQLIADLISAGPLPP